MEAFGLEVVAVRSQRDQTLVQLLLFSEDP